MKLHTIVVASIFAIAGCSSDTDNFSVSDDGTTEPVIDALTSATEPNTNDLSANGLTTDMPDPTVLNTIEVSFEISVPAYQSDEFWTCLNYHT